MSVEQSPASPVDTRVAKALSHPLRPQILRIVSERVASPNEIAQELGEPLGNVSYHTRFLRDLGFVELVRTEPRRGAVEHFYRAIERPVLADDQWKSLPSGLRRQLSGQALRDVIQDAAAAATTGGFDREGVHVTRNVLALDAQGFGELADLLRETIQSAQRIQGEANERLTSAGAEAEEVPAVLGAVLFERAPEGRGAKGRRAKK
jgi:DNA-binding transcriptional ArsR family regulator